MNVPQHIAFIMDGNSTWAKAHGVPLMDGYLRGMRTMADVIVSAQEMGVGYGTFYAFSMENWGRPQKWVSEFMALALRFFKNDPSVRKVIDAGARLKVIGDKDRLSQEIRNILDKYEAETKENAGMTVQLAISYGSRDEIIRAFKKMQTNGVDPSIENLSASLDTAGTPDPDLIIRTSGKQRLSNFLLWQASYSELYFSDVLWPDFDRAELERAIGDFSNRERTFGK